MMLHELSTFPAHDQSYPTAALMSVAEHRTDLVARSANRLLSCVQET